MVGVVSSGCVSSWSSSEPSSTLDTMSLSALVLIVYRVSIAVVEMVMVGVLTGW